MELKTFMKIGKEKKSDDNENHKNTLIYNYKKKIFQKNFGKIF